jgi:hypothetical protein
MAKSNMEGVFNAFHRHFTLRNIYTLPTYVEGCIKRYLRHTRACGSLYHYPAQIKIF